MAPSSPGWEQTPGFLDLPPGSGGCTPPWKGQTASRSACRVQHQPCPLAKDLWHGICHFTSLHPECHSGFGKEAVRFSAVKVLLFTHAATAAQGHRKTKFTAKNTSSYTWKKSMSPRKKSHSSVSGQIQVSALCGLIAFSSHRC